MWCFGGRCVLLEGTGSYWSFGVRQVPLPGPCTFVVRWLNSSDWFWQGVRTQSKWRAFSMISCQLSLITPCLISLLCTLLISSSLLVRLPPPSPRTFFFPVPLLAHPVLPFPSPLCRCGLVSGDTREGFWWGPIKAYKPRLYQPHVFYNASLEAFSKFSGFHSWWLEIYCFSLRRKWMLHLCHFNGSLIMSGRIPCASFY